MNSIERDYTRAEKFLRAAAIHRREGRHDKAADCEAFAGMFECRAYRRARRAQRRECAE